jgi:hypothetical protein
MSNQLDKISLLSFFSWQLNAKNDIAYSFPVIVMRMGGPPKKKLPKVFNLN